MSDLHSRFTPVWGIVSSGPAGIILEAPRDAKDGIGSALAVSDAELLTEGPVRITWEVTERWGGTEEWRGFWLMFPTTAGIAWVYPFAYYRPTRVGFEIGEVMGGKPEDQHIRATWADPNRVVHCDKGSALVRLEDDAIHIWALGRSTVSLPLGPRLLGLYCEGSVVKVRVERG